MVELIFMLNIAIDSGLNTHGVRCCSVVELIFMLNIAIDQWSEHPWSEMLLCGRAYIHVEHIYRPVV